MLRLVVTEGFAREFLERLRIEMERGEVGVTRNSKKSAKSPKSSAHFEIKAPVFQTSIFTSLPWMGHHFAERPRWVVMSPPAPRAVPQYSGRAAMIAKVASEAGASGEQGGAPVRLSRCAD